MGEGGWKDGDSELLVDQRFAVGLSEIKKHTHRQTRTRSNTTRTWHFACCCYGPTSSCTYKESPRVVRSGPTNWTGLNWTVVTWAGDQTAGKVTTKKKKIVCWVKTATAYRNPICETQSLTVCRVSYIPSKTWLKHTVLKDGTLPIMSFFVFFSFLISFVVTGSVHSRLRPAGQSWCRRGRQTEVPFPSRRVDPFLRCTQLRSD